LKNFIVHLGIITVALASWTKEDLNMIQSVYENMHHVEEYLSVYDDIHSDYYHQMVLYYLSFVDALHELVLTNPREDGKFIMRLRQLDEIVSPEEIAMIDHRKLSVPKKPQEGNPQPVGVTRGSYAKGGVHLQATKN